MKHHPGHNRCHSRQSVLEVRVMSPRIAWYGFLRVLGGLARFSFLLAVIAGISWGVWRGIQHAFYRNPDFRLRMIDLNSNNAIDETGVAAAAGIDLTACPSLFDIDVRTATAKLKSLPSIADARVERHLPGTLVVRVIPRTPKAWISCPGAGLSEVRRTGAMLVDHDGAAYPCPPLQLESASALPVIELPASADHPITAGNRMEHPALEHCLRLLDSARAADPDAAQWIESIRQVNEWSLELVTRHGTKAIFALGDHPRQIESLRAAIDHSCDSGYTIETINLIPRYNIPITVRDETAPPKAILVTPPSTPGGGSESRHARDLGSLLNRN